MGLDTGWTLDDTTLQLIVKLKCEESAKHSSHSFLKQWIWHCGFLSMLEMFPNGISRFYREEIPVCQVCAPPTLYLLLPPHSILLCPCSLSCCCLSSVPSSAIDQYTSVEEQGSHTTSTWNSSNGRFRNRTVLTAFCSQCDSGKHCCCGSAPRCACVSLCRIEAFSQLHIPLHVIHSLEQSWSRIRLNLASPLIKCSDYCRLVGTYLKQYSARAKV